jgi:hypothetical protein
MSPDSWPTSDAAPAPLPQIEDLPLADHGYDQEAVRLAFDSFYRHAAQLDASLRALEAVEVFRRDADALRNDLRALRALGLGGGAPEPAWATRTYESARPDIPGVVFRLAAESALIVTVAVIAGVGKFSSTVIVVMMAVAFLIVALSEWLAARARFVPPSVAFLPAELGEPAPYVEAPAPGWGPQALEPGEDTEADALTVIAGTADDVVDADDVAEDVPDDVVDPWEHGASEDGTPEAEAEAGPEPELAERSGIFRRRRR